MPRKDFDGLWREAYIDLHAAYLATLRIRHARRGDPPEDSAGDMELADPFDMRDVSGVDALRKWKAICIKHKGFDELTDAMTAGTVAIKNHWDSWSELVKAFPSYFGEYKPLLPSDEYMTSTAPSREAILEKARILAKAWEQHSSSYGHPV